MTALTGGVSGRASAGARDQRQSVAQVGQAAPGQEGDRDSGAGIGSLRAVGLS